MNEFAAPHVELIAHTTLACDGRSPVIEGHMSLDLDAGDMQQLVEFAGRACYQSFHKPNPATARNKDYIARTLHEQEHWSIAEHATATFYITGVSRALTHELIRHRHLSYSQLSQRFVDESNANIVIPPAAEGLPRKQAREAARAVLPNMIETKIVVTGNLRAWHEVITRRTAPDADAEFQQVARLIRDELKKIAPAIFTD